MNVLMIDDDPNILSVSQSLVANMHTVSVAENLSVALNVLKNRAEQYDAILLDLSMNMTDLPGNVQRRMTRRMYAGWAFYAFVLLEDYPTLAKRTIIFTGHLKEFSDWLNKNDREQWRDLKHRVIAKGDVNQTLTMLKCFEMFNSTIIE